MTETSMILMFAGKTEKIDTAIRMLKKFKIIEMIRTGKIVMSRGEGVS
jgi:acetolactate synthase-1/3 small subunit